MKKTLSLILVSFLFASFAIAQGGSATATDSSKSTSADTTAKAPAFRPTKDQIMQGQKFLKEQKLYSGEATGVYNDETRGAIKGYQKANGLAITGNFNQATLEKMKIALTDKQKGTATDIASGTAKTGAVTPTDSTASKADAVTPTDSKASNTTVSNPSWTATDPKRPAPFRANDEQIKAAQKILRDGKMLTGGEDGKLDDLTREGLGKYQDANSLKVTKTLNAGTLEKMGIALTDKQKEQVAAQAAYDAAKAAQKN